MRRRVGDDYQAVQVSRGTSDSECCRPPGVPGKQSDAITVDKRKAAGRNAIPPETQLASRGCRRLAIHPPSASFTPLLAPRSLPRAVGQPFSRR